jgi:spore protease
MHNVRQSSKNKEDRAKRSGKQMEIGHGSARIDLALEAKENASLAKGEQIPGVHTEAVELDGMFITRIHIENEEGAKALNKQIGHYSTIEVPGLRQKDSALQDRVAQTLAKEFALFMENVDVDENAKTLIIGLGNWNVTPDSLGPLVVDNVLVTRHFFELMPDKVRPGYRQVSAVAPGVLGTTGIETGEIVQGIVDRTKPDLVIAVDALASRSLKRVNTTIQIADTGIHPGSGIGNKRKALDRETLGVPVIAVGVPTVVYASTIVDNSIEMVIRNARKQTDNTDAIFGAVGKLSGEERLAMVREVLKPLGQDLLVTPKEIDQFIEDMANIIAVGLNAALHEAVDMDNVSAYTH